MTEAAKKIILCADDFAQSEAVSSGIVSLAVQHRINAISCLVNMPCWSEMHEELQPIKSSVFIGLHVNLTFGQALSAAWRQQYGDHFLGLGHLIQQAYSRRLELSIVIAEIRAQMAVFTQDMHIYPDFIDGHQHIQQLPVIRDALLTIYQEHHNKVHDHPNSDNEHHDSFPCFLRKTYNGWQDFLAVNDFPKRQILAMLGGRTWQRKLLNHKVSTNNSFEGLYQFRNARHYRRCFKRFLARITDGGLIMCHPGQASKDHSDPLVDSRYHELDYFMGDEFLQDLKDNSIQLLVKQP